MLAEMYDGDPEEYDEAEDVFQEGGSGEPENSGKTDPRCGDGSADEYDEQDDPPSDDLGEKEDQKDERPGVSSAADEYDESDVEPSAQAGQETSSNPGAEQAAAGDGSDALVPGRGEAGSDDGSDRYDVSDLYQQAVEKAKALAEHGAAQAAVAESAGKDIEGITGDILARNGQTIASISKDLAENTVKGAGQTPGDTTQRLLVEVSRLKGGQDDVEKILGS